MILKGNTALITGASSGIGAEFARQFGAMGCDLIITARRKERLDQLAQEIANTHTVNVDTLSIDLSEPDAGQELYQKVVGLGRSPNIIVNNAGSAKFGDLTDFSWEDQKNTIFLNALAPTQIAYCFLPMLRSAGKKSYLLNIASIGAYHPVSSFAVYSATKSYLKFFSEAIGLEMLGTNVSVTCVCPGGTRTEFFESSGQAITRSGELAMLPASSVVRGSIRAMLGGQSVYVPGWLNKLACFLPRFLPEAFTRRLANIILSRATVRTQVEAK